MVEYKKCSKCQKEKSVNEFYKLSTVKSGIRAMCKLCSNEYLKTEKYRKYQNNLHKTEKYKIKRREHNKKRREQDPIFKLIHNLGVRLRNSIRANKSNKTNRTQNYIGCSIEQLKVHLEKQFQSGMNWDNYGEWHIDHIKPIAKFDYTNEHEIYNCWHYTNLQPLWRDDNLKKRDKYHV